MDRRTALALMGATLAAGPRLQAASTDKPAGERGTVEFRPLADPNELPERYRLEAHRFDFETEHKFELPSVNVDVWHLRFPSPVDSGCKENDTVHAEYYKPAGKGPFPGVVVLDITAGDQTLSRSMATHMARNGIAALFVQMAYYGPRRPAGSDLRLLMPDYRHTLAAIRQTVLDVRRAAAWLAQRPEIDGKHLGIHGTSLGSFVGSLTAEMEPRFRKVSVLLGGGGLVDAYYDEPRAAPLINLWKATGGTKEAMKALIAPVDPLTCADRLKDRQLLIIAGKRDDIVPPRASEALWQATGKQKIVWYDCTHYGAALYVVPMLGHIVKHFQEA